MPSSPKPTSDIHTVNYICPLCSETLVLSARSFVCVNNHCFDIAKEGYVNLLPVQHKKSKQPGDSAEMINSRRRFLNAGDYNTLRDALHQRIHTPVSTGKTLIDVGCGEGFYLDGLNIDNSNGALHITACDIAKPAVRATAKRMPTAQCSVANAYHLPFADNSFDIALSVFSPLALEELKRVLKPNARLIAVGPGPEHLHELAQRIYKEVHAHEGNFKELRSDEGFVQSACDEIHYRINASKDILQDLLRMTPYYWSARPETQEQLGLLDTLDISVHFEIAEFMLQKV